MTAIDVGAGSKPPRSHWLDRLFVPVDAASLLVLRTALGAILLIAVVRYFAHGWIDEFFTQPTVFFPWEGLEWIAPLPRPWMFALYALLGALAALVIVGVAYPLSLVLFSVGFLYTQLIDRTNYLNHYYLVDLLCVLLACMPLGRAAGTRGSDALPFRRSVPFWCVAAVRLQLSIVYLYAGIAKLHPDWMLHAVPLRIWLSASGDAPLLGPWLELPAVAYVFSWAGALFDLAIAPLLWWSRTRMPAYVAVVLFHVMTAVLFPIGIFPWVMLAATTVFFAPDWPRALARTAATVAGRFRRVRSNAGIAASAASARLVPADVSPARRRLAVALLAAHFAVQVIVPMRFLFYPGDVLWTEEGFRFAWRIMLMEKHGVVTFRVRDPQRDEDWTVDPETRLTPLQARMMATQPDMILAFAHTLADEHRRVGGEAVEVRADAFASLNGRPQRRLIDPTVDLAAEPATWRPKRWILPLVNDEQTVTAHAR